MTIEVFYMSEANLASHGPESCWFNRDGERLTEGWYWWSCEPGCIPDDDGFGPFGPFETRELAQEDSECE